MHRVLRRSLSLLFLLMASAVSAQPPGPAASVDSALVANLKDAQWTPGTPPPSGVVLWPVAGDGKTGPSLYYAKWPAGAAFPPHWHSFSETAVVITGTLSYSTEGKPYEVGAGSVIIIPAKQMHHWTCHTDGPCILLIRRTGPTDFHFEK